MKTQLVYLGIILTLYLFLFKVECGKPEKKGDDIKVNGKKYEIVDIRIDTVFVKAEPEIRYKPGRIIYKDTTIYQDVPSFGAGNLASELEKSFNDSIMREYYAKKVFKDTIRFKEFGNVYIQDTLQENSILGRIVNSDLIFANTNKTITVKEKPKNGLYLGAKTILLNGMVNGVGTGLILKTKRERMYGVGALIDRQKNLNFTLDFYIKL